MNSIADCVGRSRASKGKCCRFPSNHRDVSGEYGELSYQYKVLQIVACACDTAICDQSQNLAEVGAANRNA